jgi:hypothetical protein
MRLTSALAVFLAFGATAFAADAQLMNLVMPDVKVLAGMNVTSAKNSPLGEFLISRIPAASSPILQDVTEVLAASNGKGGIALLLGSFDAATITAALPKTKNSPAIAFIGTTIVVVGDEASVNAAVARSTGTNSMDPALATQVSSLSAANDAWVVSTASPASLLPASAAAQAQQVSQFLVNIQGFSGGVKFGENVPVTLDVVANSPQNAEALGNVVKLLLSMAGSTAGPIPSLLQSLQVNTSGSTLDLALTVPEAQIEALIASFQPPAKPAIN